MTDTAPATPETPAPPLPAQPALVTIDSAPLPGGGTLEILQPEGLDPTQAGSGSGAPPEPAPPPVAPPGEPAPAAQPTRTMQGPRGTVAAVPDNIEEVSGLVDMLRRASRVTPSPMPAARAHDFIQIGPRSIAVREASVAETDEVARILGSQTPDTVRLISTRGDYMPTDVQEFVSAVRQANTTLFDELKRGVQTRDQQIELAQRLGLDGAVDALLTRKPGEAFNNEGLISGALAVINATRETAASQAALRAAVPGSPDEIEALARFGMNHALTAALAGQLNGAAAEAGRALGALRFVGDAIAATPPSARGQAGPTSMRVPDNGTAQSIVEALGGAEVLRAQGVAWAALPNDAARARFAQRSMGARVVDAVVAAYINSLLWLPTTHIKNIFGTAVMGLWSIPERAVAGAIGAARARIPGMSQDRVMMGEALAQMYGIWGGFGEGLSAAAQAFRTNQPAGGISRLELPRPNAISAEAFQISGTPGRALDLVGTVLTTPGRGLVTADSFFTTVGQRMELLAQAVRTRDGLIRGGMSATAAEAEVTRMLANPPEMWRDAAEASARAMTFQDEMTGALGQLSTVMQHPLAKLFVPFFNTPTNVARAVINRSPMALMLPTQAWADIRAGGARADLAISRIALGSAMMWWFSGAVMNAANDPDFRITGSRPNEATRREAFERQGFQPFSICNRRGSTWTCRSYSGADPISGLLAMAADTANYTLDHPRGSESMTADLEDLAMGSSFGLYQYMLEQPFLRGVSDLARTLGDGRMESGERFRKTMELLTQQATTAVVSPLTFGSLGAGIERGVDPATRSAMPTDPATAQDGPVVRGFFGALRRAQARMPGASEALEPVLNIWGEQVQPTDGGLWPLFWPIRTTTGRGDALETTLYRLGGALAMPEKKWPGTNVELTAQQYNALVRETASANNPAGSGGTMREEVQMVTEQPGFIDADPAQKLEMIRDIRNARFRAARQIVLERDAGLAARVGADNQHRETFGRSPRGGADMPAMR